MEPSVIPPQAEAQELESFRDMDDPRFLGMQPQSQVSFQDLVDLVQGRFSLFACPAHDHEIVAVSNRTMAVSEHLVIEGVEECVAQ